MNEWEPHCPGENVKENPWRHLPRTEPFVLPDDAEKIRAFNAKARPNHFLHIEQVLPDAFVGAQDAPVVLLSNNPGFTEKGLQLKQNKAFMAKMRDNLLHKSSEYPFIYLDPEFEGPSKKWWERKLKHLLAIFMPEVVARSIVNIPYFPYPSSRFGHYGLRLPSQRYTFHLVRKAVKRGAVIVRMRRGKGWFAEVPKLEGYDRLFEVKNKLNPVISPKNCSGFEEVVLAIATAEAKRIKTIRAKKYDA